MKAYVAILAAGMLLSGAAYAQSSNTSGSQSASHDWGQNSQTQSQTQSGTNQMNSQASNGNAEQALEGCVTRQETDYYITPVNGQAVRIRNGKDLSSAENHKARVHGHYENPNQSASSGAGSTASSQTASSQSGTASGSSQTSQSSQMGNNAGQPSGMTSQPGSGSNAQNGQEFVVTKVDSVSTACPNNTQNGTTQR